MRFTPVLVLIAGSISSVLGHASISSFPNSLTLSSSFDPIKAAYWTGLPHHRRTPFSVSQDGKSAYLAYLDSTYSNVIVQQVDVSTFEEVGTAFSTAGYEAAGLVAQDDGFALMATVNATGTTDLPTDNYPIVSLIRYKDGAEAWRTPLNGPGVHAADGLTATPDANGDLVYSSASGLYAAYFVVTAYTGDAAGHFGDSIQYVDDTGALQTISSSSTFGCSHNTGIGLEASDAPPFASVCAEDHGAIWLNTDTQYMSGVKIANENTTNGVSGEPMGGMSGSYSNLALFPSTTQYIFAWQSRGALDLTLDTWMGSPYTQCSPRWLNHNVAIATTSSKDTLTGAQALSTVGATEGDSQVNWITESTTEDHQNVHVATINSDLSLVTWETLTSPDCQPVPLGCSGTYAGTSFQLVDSSGAKSGATVTSSTVFVSGDIANVGTDKVCWPYVEMTWDLSAPKASGALVTKMSFACASTGNSSVTTSSAVVASSSSVIAASSSATKAGVTTSPEAITPSSSAVVVGSSSATDAGIVTTSPAVVQIISSTLASVIGKPTPPSSPESETSLAAGESSTPISSLAASSPASSFVSIPSTSTSTKKHGHQGHYTTFSTVARPSSTASAQDDDACEG